MNNTWWTYDRILRRWSRRELYETFLIPDGSLSPNRYCSGCGDKLLSYGNISRPTGWERIRPVFFELVEHRVDPSEFDDWKGDKEEA